MASSEDALETYTHLPIQIDPQSKQLTTTASDKSLQDALAAVNSLHREMLALETPNKIPGPPLPINPKRSANVNKLRESAAASARKGQNPDAIRLLAVATDMAAARPGWEPVGLAREELANMYCARANANIIGQNWVEGWKDAEASITCKSGPQQTPNGPVPGNPKAFALGGRCLVELARYKEAIQWLEKGLELEGREGPDAAEMKKLLEQSRRQVGEEVEA